MSIEPDTKDWTWVLERPCPECSYDSAAVDPARLPTALRATARRWKLALADPDCVVRPGRTSGRRWSTPATFGTCTGSSTNGSARMLDEDDPSFASWDQDATAVQDRYGGQDPAIVARDFVEATGAVADRYAGVTGDQWSRSGRRSDGARFTVATLGRYHLHDVEHHLYDVGS